MHLSANQPGPSQALSTLHSKYPWKLFAHHADPSQVASYAFDGESATKQATLSAAASRARSAGTGAVKRRPTATNGWNRLLYVILLRLSRQLAVLSPHLPTSGNNAATRLLDMLLIVSRPPSKQPYLLRPVVQGRLELVP